MGSVTAVAARAVAALGWLGNQGTRAVAAAVLLGILLPQLGAFFRPYVAEGIFALLCTAFMRLDPAAFRRRLRQPAVAVGATLWTMLAVPLLLGLLGLATGLDEWAPALFLALIVQGVASPMMAAPAFAALMGLDATLVLLTLVASTALVPFSAPLLAHLFVGPALAIAPLALGTKLALLLAGSAALGLSLRRILGGPAVERLRPQIDGLNVLLLFVFGAAVMSGLGPALLGDPLGTLALALLAAAVFAVLLGATALVFRRTGRAQALVLGLMTGQRNMGLMLAAAGSVLPEAVWLYIAVSQLPIYLSPLLLTPLARRLSAARSGG